MIYLVLWLVCSFLAVAALAIHDRLTRNRTPPGDLIGCFIMGPLSLLLLFLIIVLPGLYNLVRDTEFKK